jgi:hypothetical protein
MNDLIYVLRVQAPFATANLCALAHRFYGSSAAMRTALLISLAVICLPTFAQSFVQTDEAKYRCAVLGETRSCKPPEPLPLVRIEDRLELGAQAKYLMYLGASRDEAIEKARRLGEHPLRRTVRITTRELTGYETWARAMGQNIAPYEWSETLSVTVDAGDEDKRPLSRAGRR